MRAIYLGHLTMKLSGAQMRRQKTKLIYPDDRSPPWLTDYTAAV